MAELLRFDFGRGRFEWHGHGEPVTLCMETDIAYEAYSGPSYEWQLSKDDLRALIAAAHEALGTTGSEHG